MERLIKETNNKVSMSRWTLDWQPTKKWTDGVGPRNHNKGKVP